MNHIKFGANTAKIMSFLFAVILWVQVATKTTYTDKVHIPIRYTEPTDGYILSSPPPEELLVNIRGTGKQLISYRLNKLFNTSLSYASVNITGLSKGKHLINVDKNSIYISNDKGIVTSSILDNSFFPVVIDRKITRTLSVNTKNIDGLVIDKNYVIFGSPVASPEFVVVEGPQDYIDSLKRVNLVVSPKTVISAFKLSVFAKPLVTNPFVKVEPDEITVRFSLEPVINEKAKVPVNFTGFPDEAGYIFSPDSVNVEIEGPESVIKAIRKKDIRAVAYNDSFISSRERGDDGIPIKIFVPDGVINFKVSPDKISFKQAEIIKSK